MDNKKIKKPRKPRQPKKVSEKKKKQAIKIKIHKVSRLIFLHLVV